eukprot:513345_1
MPYCFFFLWVVILTTPHVFYLILVDSLNMLQMATSDSEEKERLVSDANQVKLKQRDDEQIMVEIQWSLPNKRGIRYRTKIKPHVKRTFSDLNALPHQFVKDVNKGTYDKLINKTTDKRCITPFTSHGNWISWLWISIMSFCVILMITGRINSPNDAGYWLLLFPISIIWILYAFEWNFISDTTDYLALIDSKENM